AARAADGGRAATRGAPPAPTSARSRARPPAGRRALRLQPTGLGPAPRRPATGARARAAPGAIAPGDRHGPPAAARTSRGRVDLSCSCLTSFLRPELAEPLAQL